MQWSKEKGKIMIYKILHRKLKIKQLRTQLISGVNSGAPEGLAA